jgi:hypothetical protein
MVLCVVGWKLITKDGEDFGFGHAGLTKEI